MTWINSNDFYSFAWPVATLFCLGVLVWAIWLGIKLDER